MSRLNDRLTLPKTKLWFEFGLCFLFQACVIDEPNHDLDQAGVEQEESSCGQVDGLIISQEDDVKVAVEYGYGRPFEVSEFDGNEIEPIDLLMEYGLQGGHHVDLSLRFTGSINPDLVDIRIDLQPLGLLAEEYYGIHETLDWYLLFPQAEEEEGCYFHRARVFLFDLEGQAVQPLDVERLNGSTAELTFKLTTSHAEYNWTAKSILHDATSAE